MFTGVFYEQTVRVHTTTDYACQKNILHVRLMCFLAIGRLSDFICAQFDAGILQKCKIWLVAGQCNHPVVFDGYDAARCFNIYLICTDFPDG